MRSYILALVLVAACGEVSPAGNVTLDGSMAGAGGAAGTTGSAGATGNAGTTGAGGTCARSCAISIDQVSAMTTAVWQRGNRQGCTDGMLNVTIAAGAIVSPPATSALGAGWMLGSYMVTPRQAGCADTCDVQVRYDRITTDCGAEALLVAISVPAI